MLKSVLQIKNFWHDWTTTENRDKVQAILYEQAVERCFWYSLAMAICHSLYGMTSVNYLTTFDPSITYLNNTIPRLLVGTLPTLLLMAWLRRSSVSDETKCLIWIISFTSIFVFTCAISVWRLAWQVDAGIFQYVDSINYIIVLALYTCIAPPFRMLIRFFFIIGIGVWAPILYIKSHKMGLESGLFQAFVNDLFASHVGVLAVTLLIMYDRSKAAKIFLLQKSKALVFAGSRAAKVIFNNGKIQDNKKDEHHGYFIFIDIRKSTAIKNDFGIKKYDEWISHYLSFVANLAAQHLGHIEKTAGDGIYLTFGVQDDEVSLPLLDEILRSEEDIARTRQANYYKEKISLFLADLGKIFDQEAASFFPGRKIHFGAGVSYGNTNVVLRGDPNSRLEFDLDGEMYALCTRLEAVAKSLHENDFSNSNLVVVGGKAIDYFLDCDKYIEKKNLVKDFPEIERVALIILNTENDVFSKMIS